ncbi:MAG: MBL fold metallo-hydrolase [Candidatus Omnitrophica bacterium]|nr:MBL fold metallo-hydrolase [Candidatus Omnitrophota bacterium]
MFIYKNQIFLIDCPGSIVQKLLKVKVDFRILKNIIITHQHPDHIYGIVSFIHSQMYFNKLLNIFTNRTCIKIIKKLIKIFDLDKPNCLKIKFFDVFKNTIFYKFKDLKLYAIRNKHIKDSFGIKFIFDKKALFYSSDTSFSEKMLNKVEKINYLIYDCTASSSYFKKYPQLYNMHTCAKDLANYLQKNKNIKKLIPVHFLLLNKKEEQRIKDELAILGNRVIFPEDFDIIRL